MLGISPLKHEWTSAFPHSHCTSLSLCGRPSNGQPSFSSMPQPHRELTMHNFSRAEKTMAQISSVSFDFDQPLILTQTPGCCSPCPCKGTKAHSERATLREQRSHVWTPRYPKDLSRPRLSQILTIFPAVQGPGSKWWLSPSKLLVTLSLFLWIHSEIHLSSWFS